MTLRSFFRTDRQIIEKRWQKRLCVIGLFFCVLWFLLQLSGPYSDLTAIKRLKSISPYYFNGASDFPFPDWYYTLLYKLNSEYEPIGHTKELWILMLEPPTEDSFMDFMNLPNREERYQAGYKPRSFTEKEPALIAELDHLKCLVIVDGDLKAKDISTITENVQLNAIALEELNSLESDAFQNLSNQTKLLTLLVSGNISFTQEDLNAISKLKNLEDLELGPFKNNSVQDYQPLKECTKLASLELQVDKLSPEIIDSLPSLFQLSHLSLKSNEQVVIPEMFDFSTRFPDLISVSIGDNIVVTDTAMEQISKLTHLEELWIKSSTITDEGFAVLANHHNLNAMELNSSRFSDKALKIIASFPHLERVYSNSPHFTTASIENFYELRPDISRGNGCFNIK